MKETIKVIIAGGRGFSDYELLKAKCDFYLSHVSSEDTIEIISGTANGADKLGERYALEKKYKLAYFPANWEKHGKRGGYLRNQEMADYAGEKGALILFWDGESKGSGHMLDIAKRKGMHTRIVKY